VQKLQVNNVRTVWYLKEASGPAMLATRAPDELEAVKHIHEKYERDYRAYVQMLQARPQATRCTRNHITNGTHIG